MSAQVEFSESDTLTLAARQLQKRHATSRLKPRPIAPWSELYRIEGWLQRARTAASDPPSGAVRAAEWLLDNDYQVQRAVLQIEPDLPVGFYERLPSLEDSGSEGVPRIFAIGYGLLQASHLQLSLTTVVRFIRSYQEGTPLTIAELWALPTMLRLACLEILACRCARLFPDLKPPFAPTQLVALLDRFDDTECISRALANLGVISSIQWKDFFDRASSVEAILRDEPARAYQLMDFDSRDRYRKAVEEIAACAGRPEMEIAECAVFRARQAKGSPHDHVGYWLVGEGRGEFETLIGLRRPRLTVCSHWLRRHAGVLYAAALIAATATALLVPATYLSVVGAGSGGWILGIALTLLPASVLGVAAVHGILALVVRPQGLPKLDFEKAIPADCATAVVVPVILHGADEVPHVMERLERHWLSNRDRSLRFVVLSDLSDAPAGYMPGDQETEQVLLAGIQRLNSRYGQTRDGPFHLLHRPRRFNPSEGRWMGWERKRGKLEALNRLILDGDTGGFSLREGNAAELGRTRFVVTVDADTVLPPGSVSRLVGALAHPLNSARFDERTGRVRAGYTVLQPRVEISPENGNRSLFARLYAGNTAIDIYTRAVSDVYQDLFGSGMYTGKGIYEVAPFHRSLDGRVPENALLSHDLFEGIQGRAALASDIVLYEDFPISYVEYARRWHRWVRGDWQLLPWLARRVPGAGGKWRKNPLTLLDRWKVFDNLQRSLVPPSLLLLSAAGWLGLPGEPWVWMAFAVATPGCHFLTDLLTAVGRSRYREAVRGAFHQLSDPAGRWLLAVVFLANDAIVALDAVARTFWRLIVSRRHLLEWTSAAQLANAVNSRSPRAAAWRYMWPASALSAAAASAVALLNPSVLLPAAPLLLLWFAAPEIAAWLSRPRDWRTEELGRDDLAFLRQLARRTWLFFETFVGPADNWLPPDNVQMEPYAIAHRTSPTNIGMMFLSSLAAWDLGYVGSTDLAVRIRNGLDTLDRLERYRGHLLNWYDTQRLKPLEPRYVSTVDSGNLAVSLLALKEGCREAACAPAVGPGRWDGLADTLGALAEATERFPEKPSNELRACLAAMMERIDHARSHVSVTSSVLTEICERTFPELEAAIAGIVAQPAEPQPETLHDIQSWLGRTRHHLSSMKRDIETLAPWIPLIETPAPGCEGLAHDIAELIAVPVSISDVETRCASAHAVLEAAMPSAAAAAQWLAKVDAALKAGAQAQAALRRELLDVSQRSGAMAFAMDFRSLYDVEARLFRIGYNVSTDRIDPSHYDLLASEARLASFFAIAKGDVAFEHWFHLGRLTVRAKSGLSLVSWGGSMFEYLMPGLLLRSGIKTLIGQSERAAVDAQRRYADQRGIPWGTSESAFASRDANHNYRYSGFGIAELGLRRGLSRDLVVAPYATALALPIAAKAAVRNLRALARLGLAGSYGLFEAADFTPERVARGVCLSPVRAYMAHHQGMTLAALDNALCDEALIRRFHADPRVRAVELLVHERVPWETPPSVRTLEKRRVSPKRRTSIPAPQPWKPRSAEAFPQMHALGNGRLASWITEAGGGRLSWHDHALTRWLPDATRDNHGLWMYVRDEEDGSVWSVGRQPTGVAPDDARVMFHPHMAEFHRHDHGVGISMEVGVVPGDDLEIRRMRVVNEGERPRRLRFTSYGEVVLAPPLEDERHPCFSKLFVGSEHLPALNGLLFSRRRRHPQENPPVLLHWVVLDEAGVEIAGFETDRRHFLGRQGDARRPYAVKVGLSRTAGWTLDPVMALQVQVALEPHERRQFAFLTMADGSRETLLTTAQRYATLASVDWALNDAAAEAAREAQQLGLDGAWLPDLQVLASLLVYRHHALRAAPEVLATNKLGQPRLWALGISGDHPVLLVHAGDPKEMDLLHTLVAGHQLWRRRGIHVDLVVLRGGATGYLEPFRERLTTLLQDMSALELLGRNGGIHLILADEVNDEERRLVEASAQAILDASKGPLARQIASATESRPRPPRLEPTGRREPVETAAILPHPADLVFDNGLGGITGDGREYVIHLQPGEKTPAPWCNVLANERFGTIVSETGLGFTWAINSGENRLTPWTNDPVADPPSEALYLRDEETAEIWTPTPSPAGEGAACEIRHGAGYTVWRRVDCGVEQELLVFVPPDDPAKIVRLKLRNPGIRTRRITATYYAEWLLGSLSGKARSFVVCEYNPACHALLARNPWNPDFCERVAFLTSTRPPHSLTTDRRDFLGREGNLRAPTGLKRWDLGGRVEAGADPCAAFQVHLDIGAGDGTEVVFVLGQGDDQAHAVELARRWQEPGRADHAFEELAQHWDRRLSAVQVKTPDPAFDLMVNRWLLYQTLASRILARAGFYQAGGGIGFRDQLQDVLALFHAEPERVRAHILTAAARQFEEGDVLHWWHPPNGRGVRTRCSDDLLWLPYVAGCYVEATGDASILHEKVPFLRAVPLTPEEEDRYARFDMVSEPRSLFEHCERALARGVTQGAHGLPLIGTGDWNDGMNRVGRKGRGESVWLAWFAVATIKRFVALSLRMGRDDLAGLWRDRVGQLEQAIEAIAWDGKWYVRAFDDDGLPIGSARAKECRIDSIAQSWAVLASDGISERGKTAVENAVRELIREDQRLIRLLWPPFDATPQDLGYIKAYPPGVRENGGQYTHAAAWLGHAFARLGDGDQAAHIFDLLNPIRNASTRTDMEHYRVEPYVVAADIASVAPHTGCGGWTWYTGSAAWILRLGVEAILGLRLHEGNLLIDPCLPKHWGSFEAEIKGPKGSLAIRVEDPERIGKGQIEVEVDGIRHMDIIVALPTDGSTHRVRVRLRKKASTAAKS
ncbi:cyclic beta-1,2-glucan synthetase [Sinorhizobium fredii]|uniref:Protein NdvB n=1 Tax=Sinorhizobium fredii (strain USDA 257) TaxID=1185652 RepID=I3XFZ6_SINF2|nr:protein NdvB [Sinorhizobium fredii USDA 257]CCE99088.1 K13688 cyclic beta-1,2-glucan synthetase [Sinorhizobium fredii HH103]CEO91773.1 cyclic beta-1,2-glucan synthetase-like [Sinorhizobium fredii HH103]